MRRVFLLRNFCNSSGITNRCTPTHTATLVFVYRCAPLYTKTLSAVCAGERGVSEKKRALSRGRGWKKSNAKTRGCSHSNLRGRSYVQGRKSFRQSRSHRDQREDHVRRNESRN